MKRHLLVVSEQKLTMRKYGAQTILTNCRAHRSGQLKTMQSALLKEMVRKLQTILHFLDQQVQTREGFLRKNIVAVSFFQHCAIHPYS